MVYEIFIVSIRQERETAPSGETVNLPVRSSVQVRPDQPYHARRDDLDRHFDEFVTSPVELAYLTFAILEPRFVEEKSALMVFHDLNPFVKPIDARHQHLRLEHHLAQIGQSRNVPAALQKLLNELVYVSEGLGL
jgi:hypothetical protein